MMGIPGENLPHVSHYYTEAHSFYDRDVVVIGGKNSAAEAALDLFRGGARVSLSIAGATLGQTVKYWVRPDIENRFKNGEITPYMNSKVARNHSRPRARSPRTARFARFPPHQVFALTGYHCFNEVLRSTRCAVRLRYTPRSIQSRNIRNQRSGSLPGRICRRWTAKW